MSYTNPVFAGYFADPFVLRADDGAYYAFGTADFSRTGSAPFDNNRFPVLRSTNLIHWEHIGGALIPPEVPGLGSNFWAPEVARGDDGRFYMYYSVGPEGEMLHQLRVAVSEMPHGPYRDAGGPPLIDLTTCPFAIDAHPFRDDDGLWYLFYSRDFLDAGDSARAGTGLVVDRLLPDMMRLAGEEKTVLRARLDWQRFQKDRHMAAYGGNVFDWHTLEGAFVVKRGGKYYCFYSGSSYQTLNYGVDYAVAEHVLGPYSDAGAEDGPRVLRSVAGKVRGPGHNSIVLAPDGETPYIVYHAWDDAHRHRQMCLDRLIWTEDGPRCLGPTTDPQPAPP